MFPASPHSPHTYPTVRTIANPCLHPGEPLHHIATRVVDLSPDQHASGFSVWGTTIANGRVYFAFDWTEIRVGVPLLRDPNSVSTNLVYLDERGVEYPALRQISLIASLLHQSPWQPLVTHFASLERQSVSLRPIPCIEHDAPCAANQARPRQHSLRVQAP